MFPFHPVAASVVHGTSESGNGCALLLIIIGVGIAILATAVGLLLGFFIADDPATGASLTSTLPMILY